MITSTGEMKPNCMYNENDIVLKITRIQDEKRERIVRYSLEGIKRSEELDQHLRDKAIADNEYARKRLLGDLTVNFEEPTSQVKTKTLTNNYGAKVSYNYYINENGYEVIWA